jgi:hypothetical protein
MTLKNFFDPCDRFGSVVLRKSWDISVKKRDQFHYMSQEEEKKLLRTEKNK